MKTQTLEGESFIVLKERVIESKVKLVEIGKRYSVEFCETSDMKMYGTITFTGAFIEILGVDLEKNSFLPRLIWKVTPAE